MGRAKYTHLRCMHHIIYSAGDSNRASSPGLSISCFSCIINACFALARVDAFDAPRNNEQSRDQYCIIDPSIAKFVARTLSHHGSRLQQFFGYRAHLRTEHNIVPKFISSTQNPLQRCKMYAVRISPEREQEKAWNNTCHLSSCRDEEGSTYSWSR